VQLNRKERTLAVTIGVNVGLIILKFGLAWYSGSLALKAGAWHSFSDILVSGIVLSGLILARKEDVRHSHGISRIENAVALVIGLLILYAGCDIFLEVVQASQITLTNVPIVIAGAGLTIVISFFMARYKIFVGRETDSPSLIADGFHSKLDMYSSIVVVFGLIGYQIGLTTMDRMAAVVVVALVAWAGLEIMFGASLALRTGGLPDVLHGNYLLRHTVKWTPFLRKAGAPILLIAYLVTGMYTVGSDQVGIEKQFGKPTANDIQPGLHYRLPWPFSTVDLVNVAKVRSAETLKSLMLTGDENLIEVGATVHYSVQNAFDFAYNVSDPEKLVALATESALRQIISRRQVDAVLTEGKADIQEQTLSAAQEILDKTRAGIRLIAVQLVKANPPDEVLPAFQDVASAKEDQVTYLNEAYAYQNEVIPASRGKAAEITAMAEAYREEKITRSRGDAGSFQSRLAAFNESREITQTRLYIETMERILPGVDKLIVDKRIDIQATDLWMLNGRLDGGPFLEGVQK
jgi:membrane protease subunit HflK